MTHPAPRPARGRLLAALVALLLLAGLAGAAVPTLDARPAAAAACPCTIFGSTATPGTPADPDSSAVEVGVKFRSDVVGHVTGLRFYKGAGNTGTHVGSLWSTDGVRLASATFQNESSTGWQQVLLASPVAVTPGTTYIASYYAPNGHYAADSRAFASAGVDNGPLHALADGVDGANGVYRYGTGGGFPTNSWQAANYWVDVVFDTTAADSTPPVVEARSPAAGSTGVPVSSAVSATFSEPVTGATASVRSPSGAVDGATAYDAASRTLTFTPAAALATATAYTVTVSGGRDARDNVMAPDTWSFTTASTSSGCPCSLWPTTAAPATPSATDNNAVEVGTRFRSTTAGFITGLRFYKGPANTGTQVGHLWRADGTLLSTATFPSGSSTGWQSVQLPSPVAVAVGTDYVASYHAPVGGYAATSNHFSTARSSSPLVAPAHSSSTPNGVYRYGASAFPSSSYNATSYWVDVVFDNTVRDTTAPSVTGRSPSAGATDVDPASLVTATFDEAVAAATVSLGLKDATGAAVAGSTTYDATSRTATFTPAAALRTSTSHTATVSAADSAGNAMAPSTWSFTTAAPVVTPPAATGPVLVVGPAGFGRFLPELLKTEGLNALASGDLSALTADNLAKYDSVVLGETSLTAAHVTTLTAWVEGGGNLIAMRPDKQLAPLLGLTAGTTTLSDGYLLVDAAAGPGKGITAETMQFHGTADRYTLNGATAVATLYSGVSTATTSPAVTLRTVGASGGQAAAFTYDLARSVVYTRQGNPAFAGMERDGRTPIRSDDMFWGSTAANGYVNLGKVAIPQADEQQRLLANLLQAMNRDKKPLPRFWYFPDMAKAVVVATGDDHGNNGTAGRYAQHEANSPQGCSVVLWTCPRFSSYVYPSTPLPAASAREYDTKGFETGVHVSTGCANYTAASVENDYSRQVAEWKARFSGVTPATTTRLHCIVFSDWSSQIKTQLRQGMGMDTNYYYWPGSWVGDRPGFMTGSGMPMRFAELDGSVLNSYQAATQMTDESDQSYPFTPDRLLDNALGTKGYYGAFTANMHTDLDTIPQNDELLLSAQSRGVPIVAARQMLSWLQGRDASTFTDLAWSGGTLRFGISPGSGARGLQAMLPVAGATGSLTALTSGGAPVAFTKQTIKGIEYAVFDATARSYAATYGTATAGAQSLRTTTTTTATAAQVDAERGVYLRPGKSGAASSAVRQAPAVKGDAAAPTSSDVEVLSLPDGTATVTWRTDEGASSEVLYGRSAQALDERRSDERRVTEHSVTLTDLEPGATYHYLVRSVDRAGNTDTSGPARFVQSAAGVADTTAASLKMGRRDDGGHVARRGDGELQLSSEDQDDFDLPRLPDRWTTEAERGGRTVVYGGRLTVDGTRALGPAGSGPRPFEFSATFTGADQLAGMAARVDGPWAMFVGRDGKLFASISDGKAATETRLPDALLDDPHRFRVEWTNAGVSLFVDDRLVASGELRGAMSMRPTMRDLVEDGAPLTVDWVRQAAHKASTTYVSRVLDSQQMVTWDRAVWRADVPSGTAVRVSVRTGSRRGPDDSWGAWQALSGSGARVVGEGRYLQYRVELTTSSSARTPVLQAIGFTHNGTLLRHEKETR